MARLKKIQLKTRIEGFDIAQLVEQTTDVTYNLLNRILDEVFGDIVPAKVREYAHINILEANENSLSQHELTGAMEDSIRVIWNPNTRSVLFSVGDDAAPYAAVRNKPLGYYTYIQPKKSPFLQFFVPGQGLVRTKKAVRTPGSAFFDRAVEKVVDEIPSYVEKIAARLNTTDFNQSLFRVGRLGTQYYLGGSTPITAYEQGGYVSKSGALTAKGRLQMRLYGRLNVR